MKLFCSSTRREFLDGRGIASCCYMDSEFRTKLPAVAAEWLTPLLYIPEVPGSSLDMETYYHFWRFLTFPSYITAIIHRFLPHRLQSIVHLRSAVCDFTQLRLVVTDISGQPVGPIFKGQSVREDGTDMLSRNVCNKLPVCAA